MGEEVSLDQQHSLCRSIQASNWSFLPLIYTCIQYVNTHPMHRIIQDCVPGDVRDGSISQVALEMRNTQPGRGLTAWDSESLYLNVGNENIFQVSIIKMPFCCFSTRMLYWKEKMELSLLLKFIVSPSADFLVVPSQVLGLPECGTAALTLYFPTCRRGLWLTTPSTPAVLCVQNFYAQLRISHGAEQLFLNDWWVCWMRNWQTVLRAIFKQCPYNFITD